MFKITFFACLLLLIPCLAVASLAEEDRGPVDWLVLVDTSKSMIGKGQKAQNIFGQVKLALNDFVQRETVSGDTVSILYFNESTGLVDSIPIVDQGHRDKVKEVIASLQATGNYTHTGEALRNVLQRSEALQQMSALGPQNRQPVIILLTDGLEDIKPGSGARNLDSLNLGKIEVMPFLFVVWLGKNSDDVANSSLSGLKEKFGSKGFLLSHPEGKDVDKVVQQIRDLIKPPIYLSPKSLNFGAFENGKNSEARTIIVESSRKAFIRFNLVQPSTRYISAVDPAGPIPLNKGTNTIQLRLKASESAPKGSLSGQIAVDLDEVVLQPTTAHKLPNSSLFPLPSIAFSAQIFHRRWQDKLLSLSWKILTFGLITGLLIAWIFYRLGISIRDFLKSLRTGKNLQGVLAIGEESLDLASLKSNSLDLSALHQLGLSVDNSDARLRLVRVNGRPRVQMERIRGTVERNGVPIQDHVLLDDSDEIQLSGVQLIFKEHK